MCTQCSVGRFSGTADSLACEECPFGKHQSLKGKAFCLGNSAGTSVTSQAAQETTVTLAGVEKDSFTAALQLAFRQNIAHLMGIGVSLISLGSITEAGAGRRQLSSGVIFTISIGTGSGAEAVQSGMGHVSLADLVQNSSSIATAIQQAYASQSLVVPTVTAFATVPTTKTQFSETACPAGKYFPAGQASSVCLICAPGTYPDLAGAEFVGRAPIIHQQMPTSQ
jgi:hypothetical protein